MNKQPQSLLQLNLASRFLKERLVFIIIALMGGAFGFIALGAYICLSSSVRVIPYLVTVDSHGVVLSKGEATRASSVPGAVVAAQLGDFVKNMRQISSDQALQKQAILQTYSYVKDGEKAQTQLDRYYRSLNPFEIMKKKRVEVELNNVIAQGPSTYQIDWTEFITQGSFRREQKMRALISYRIDDEVPQDAQALLLNPLSIYVVDFVLSEVIGSKEAAS